MKKLRLPRALEFLWENRLWWMIPMGLVFALTAILLAIASRGPETPLVYTLF